MSAEILREFLVRIGWQNDEEGARKVGEQIRTMTLSAVALGASLESLAATAFAATARISKTYSDIFYQSRKVGSSAENIKAYTYAVEQLGGSAEGTAATLESFRRKIGELGQGQEKWLEQFIGSTRDAKGALRDTAEMVDEFLHSKRFLQASEPLQRKYLEGAGIGEGDWRASQDPRWKKQLEDAKKFYDAIGLDPQELAKKGQKFTEELRAIWMRISAIRDKFLLNLGFEEPLKKFKKYLDEHSGDILKNLNAFVDAVKPFVIAFTNAAIQVGEFASAIANKLGPDTTAWLIIAGLGLKFSGLATVITALVVPAISALGSALAALMLGPTGVAIRAIAAIAGVSAGAAAAALGVGAAATLYPTPAGKGEDEQQRQENVKRDPDYYKPGHPGAPAKKKSLWERGKQWFNDKIGIAPAEARETVEGQPGGETGVGGGRMGDIPSYAPEGGDTRADKNFNPGNIAYGPWARAHGATGAAGTDTGHGVAVFPSAQAGFEAMHDLAMQKYKGGKRTANQLIAGPGGWTPGNFQAAGNVARSMGLRPDDDLQLNDPSRMRSFQRGLAKQEGAPRLVSAFDKGKIEQERAARRKDAESRAAKPEVAPPRPEVAPQKPVHVPPVKIPDKWEDRPKYDFSKPGHPRIVPPAATTPRGTSPTTPQAPPHALAPRPLGHTTSNSVHHGDRTMNAKTTINVTTPGDPGAAARAIAGIQTRVNADAIRNMQGAAH